MKLTVIFMWLLLEQKPQAADIRLLCYISGNVTKLSVVLHTENGPFLLIKDLCGEVRHAHELSRYPVLYLLFLRVHACIHL